MSLRKKKRRKPSYAANVLRGTVSDRPKLATAIDAFNARSRMRKAKVLAEARVASKQEKVDYSRLEKDADRFSGVKGTLVNTAPADWDEMIAAVRDVAAGTDKRQALEDFDGNEPKRKWKGKRPQKRKLTPMLRRLS